MKAVIAGQDGDGLGDALASRGADVRYAAGTAARPALEEAGIHEADLLVVTDAGLATSIPVAKDLNPDVRVVVYARDTLPEFARGQAGHIVDPELLDAATVAEELI
jgi:Trk K+ transport system NAD-binding subunit